MKRYIIEPYKSYKQECREHLAKLETIDKLNILLKNLFNYGYFRLGV